MGVGFGGSVSCDFLKNYRFGFGRDRMNGKQLAIGTDINVLVKAPKPRFGSSSDLSGSCSQLRVDYYGAAALTMAQTGSKRWDYNTEGFAHYGIFPDFLQDLKNIGMTAEERTTFFSTAEDFARMWKTSEQASSYFR